jgi:TIR domain-containing protein/type VII secretion system (Wss) protein YukD
LPHIKVDIESPSGLIFSESLVPDDCLIKELIMDIVDHLQLPLLSEDNKPIEYSLESVKQNIALHKDKTLREAGISDGDSIRLTSIPKLPSHDYPELTERKRRLRVFLCHSSGDKQAVRDLYYRLRSDGLEPWLDEENLLPGQDWHHEITKAVRSSDVVLVCLSQDSINRSGFVQKEIKYALDVSDEQPEGAIFLIPLKLEECNVPERLRRWHWLNYFEGKGYERLKRSLNSRARELGISIYLDPSKSETYKSNNEDLPTLLERVLPEDQRTITVLISVMTTHSRYKYEVPLDVKVKDIKEALMKELGIVQRLEDGTWIPYEIFSKALGRRLDDHLTFRENKVPELDSLTFEAQIIAG